jgi:sulfate adenylyltransferase subunit 1
MVTAASNADAAIVLIDVTKLDFSAADLQLLPQTKRHASIAALLHLPHLIVAVNKMDAVGFDEAIYQRVVAAFAKVYTTFAEPRPSLVCLPISALKGDNIVTPSVNMPWFQGSALLSLLETLPLPTREAAAFAMAVQAVLREAGQRYYVGRVSSGQLQVGQRVQVASHGEWATVAALATAQLSDAKKVSAGQSIRLQLDREVDISRGDWLLAKPVSNQQTLTAQLTWLDTHAGNTQRRYQLRHGTRWCNAQISQITSRLDLNSGQAVAASSEIQCNELVKVQLTTQAALPFAAFKGQPHVGRFILVDSSSHQTVAAGVVFS